VQLEINFIFKHNSTQVSNMNEHDLANSINNLFNETPSASNVHTLEYIIKERLKEIEEAKKKQQEKVPEQLDLFSS
jgi:hypothetical protein